MNMLMTDLYIDVDDVNDYDDDDDAGVNHQSVCAMPEPSRRCTRGADKAFMIGIWWWRWPVYDDYDDNYDDYDDNYEDDDDNYDYYDDYDADSVGDDTSDFAAGWL